MGVFKEIPKADGSGITTFYRLDNDKDTVETTSTGGTETMIDYNKALNKPSINNVVLVGNKTLDELGIQPKGDYITEIPSEYITEEELNQKQYATESYVLDKIANIEHFSRQVVDELPLVGKDNVIYLVRKEGAGDDIYNEYIWTGTSYELFGSTATDLSDYYNKDSVNELLDTKVDKQEGKGLSTNDYTNADKSKLASLENYDDSELRAAIDSLHNYDDTEIRQEINKLSNESEAMSEKIENIDKTNDYKLEAVRLIKSGDYWIWKDSADNLIDYFKARDLLGTENCILIMEQLDSDGKSIPADYKIDGDRIRILYKDLENLNHEMYMGPPDKDTKTGNYIEIDNAAEASANKVKIYGETYQYTTTGQQLYNYLEANDITSGVSVDSDGWISISYDNSKGTSTKYFNYFTKNLDIETNTNYLIVTEIKKSSGNGRLLSVSNYEAEGQFKYDAIYKIEETSPKTYAVVNTTKDSFENTRFGLRTYVGFQPGQSGTIIFRLSVIKDTEINANNFIYEPYTGGKPSPSIDYPQEIKNVKGYRNLLDETLINKSDNTYWVTDKISGINIQANKDYYFTTYTSMSVIRVLELGTDKVIKEVTDTIELTFNVENATKVYFTIYKAENVPTNTKILFTEGNTQKPYVPYGSNYLELKANSENLFDSSTLELGDIVNANKTIRICSTQILYLKAGSYTFSNNFDLSKLRFACAISPTKPKTSSNYPNYIYNSSWQTSKSLTFSFETDGYFILQLSKENNETLTLEEFTKYQYQLTKGDTVKPYTEYQANSTLINLQNNEICEGDTLIVQNGYASIDKNKKILELSGEESWAFNNDIGGYYQYYIKIENSKPNGLSNFFKYSMTGYTEGNKFYISIKGNFVFMHPIYQGKDIEGLDNWKQFLRDMKSKGTPVIVQYELQNNQNISLGNQNSLPLFENYNYVTNSKNLNMELTYSTNTNYNENIILGDDSYYYGIVDNKQSLPEGKAKGTLCQTKDTKDFYIYNGEEWVPVDKTASFDLSNYLSKDNTTPYSPSDRYNPATKQYVDTNIQGLKIPTKVSQLENDSNYITENTNTLVNYYNKNNTYNKKEVDALIDSSGLTPVSITLNGQKTTDANFYAPASGGTANQILISQGDAAPIWQNNTAVQTVNQDIKLVISDTRPEAPSSGFILWVDSTK